MNALASALLVVGAFATQVAVEVFELPGSKEWEGWTGLVLVAGLVGFGISIWRGES